MNMNTKATGAKTKPNYYQVLDISTGVSHNEILHAYNRAKRAYSGDSLASYSLMDSEASASMLEEIEAAYVVLGNPNKRREYDMSMGFETWVDDDIVSRQTFGPTDPVLRSSAAETIPTTASAASKPEKKTGGGAKLHVLSSAVAARSMPEQSPNFEPNPEFEKRIQETAQVDGAFLKAVRIYRCLSPDQLATRCKLTSGHVIAIEDEDAERLHEPVYLRGHVSMMARELSFPNPDNIARAYITRLREQGKLAKSPF